MEFTEQSGALKAAKELEGPAAQNNGPRKAKSGGRSHVDLRVVKTRRAIRNAFEDILKQKPYTQITVTAIAEKACINRNTFYAHYDSVDDLLEETVRQRIGDVMNKAFASLDDEIEEEGLNLLTYSLILALEENLELEENLLRNLSCSQVIGIMLTLFSEFIPSEHERLGLPQVENQRCYTACYIGSVISAYVDWRWRYPHESVEQLAAQISRVYLDKASDLMTANTTKLGLV